MSMKSWRSTYSGGYLKAGDLPPKGLIGTILDFTEEDFDGRTKLVARLEDEKDWVVNVSNCQLMTDIFQSENPDDWRGKVRLVNDQTVFGPNGERGGIRVRKLEKKQRRKKTADEVDIDDDLEDLDA